MKRMTKLSMICMTLGAVLMGCSSGGDTEPDTSTTETIQSQSSEVIQSEESSISSEVEELDFEESSESSSEFKRVGEVGYSFVDIPTEWVNFQDIGSDLELIQYSDLTGTSIITLYVIENPPNNPEQAATNSWGAMEQGGATGIQGAMVELDGYETYQVYGVYENMGMMLVTYHFEDDEGRLHYISAESFQDNIMEVIGYVETFSVNE